MPVFFIIYILALLNSKWIQLGVKQGLQLLTEHIIPSLYPFIFLSSLLRKNTAEKSNILLAVIGFLSGYPIGAKIISELSYKESVLSSQDLLLLCNNPSPAFMISFVGISCFHNIYTGLFIYVAVIIGNIFTLFIKKILSFFWHTSIASNIFLRKSSIKTMSLHLCLSESIHESFDTLLNISTYIILFSVLSVLLEQLPLPKLLRALLICMFEMTSGIQELSQLNLDLNLCCICVTGCASYGGLSVIFQTYSMIQNSELSIKKYMTDKAIASIIAMSVTYIFIQIFN